MTKTDPRPALALMVGVLATWFTAWQVEQAAGLQVNSIVLATVTAVTLGQSLDRVPVTGRIRHRAATLVIVPVAALGATELGRLMAAHRWWGGLVFCLVLGAAVWVRRFGPLGTRLGSLATLPFITLLIAPTAPGTGFSLWPAALAAVAVVFVMVVRVAGGMLGLI
ncbi:MAG: hypothetical protein J2O46_09705, partial [Nocardioides sp.]|nr:hypothetical protein [Nocardioides sp.]